MRKGIYCALLASSLSAVLAHGDPQVVTVYDMDPTPTGTAETYLASGTFLGVSPIAVDQEGATVYVATRVNSLVYVEKADQTSTLLATPTTTEYTFRADASRYYHAFPTTRGTVSAEDITECFYEDDGSIRCSHKVVVDNNGQPSTAVSHHTTGTQRPIATISDVENLALPTEGADEDDGEESGAVRGRAGVVGLVIAGLAGLLL
ncbi:hypothetical protein CC2G_013621 [Coprinopsis cinerea AmutBmut pab1-1]|nr:hypothetical protein CC2G_013621 [Coprinopsis cinerea AmutBmut pab1-1]